jgi:ATP phosphoribosyltransferase regulatory subunit
VAEALQTLISFDADDADRFAAARALAVSEEAIAAEAELEGLFSELVRSGFSSRVRLDFSVVSDSDYYNGIVFSGYIDGVPKAVLTGGRYDRLAAKLGKSISALGFAVYLNELSYFLRSTEEYDADYLLLYGDNDAPSDVYAAAAALRSCGSVRIAKRPPSGFRAREIKKMGEDTPC